MDDLLAYLLLALAVTPLVVTFIVSCSVIIQIYVSGLLFLSIMLFIGFINDPTSNLEYYFFIVVSNFIVLSAAVLTHSHFLSLVHCVRRNTSFGYASRCKYDFGLFSLLASLVACFLLVVGAGGVQAISAVWVDVADELSNNAGYRIFAILAFILSIASVRMAIIHHEPIFLVLLTILFLVCFVLIVRVKLYIVPILLGLFYPTKEQRLNFLKISTMGISFLFFYIIVMFVRWLGSVNGLSYNDTSNTMKNVLEAGVERDLFSQFYSVMAYYDGVLEWGWGRAYQRLILIPFDTVFGTDWAPQNPMYHYFTIWNGRLVVGGSAHPALYADAFADFRWLGVFIPAIFLWVYATIVLRSGLSFEGQVVLTSVFMSLPLIVRGSVFYGLFYMIMGFGMGYIIHVIRLLKS